MRAGMPSDDWRDRSARRGGASDRSGNAGLVVAAAAGVIGPLVFVLVALAQAVLRAGHDPIALPISALSVGPAGWVQDINFVVYGLLLMVFAVALHDGLPAATEGVAGPALIAVMGAGYLVAGVLPAVDSTGAFSQDEIGHAVGVWMMLVGAVFAPIVLARRLARDEGWRDLCAYSRRTSIALLVLALAWGSLSWPPAGPLHGLRGLFLWAMVAVQFPWLMVVAWRLLRHARADTVDASAQAPRRPA